MELWIRTQDKKHLMKCEAIMYEKTGTGYGLRAFTKNYDFNIAGYETKERAIEVLDEIQNLLQPIIKYEPIVQEEYNPSYTYKHFVKVDDNIEIKELSTFVYQMPKE